MSSSSEIERDQHNEERFATVAEEAEESGSGSGCGARNEAACKRSSGSRVGLVDGARNLFLCLYLLSNLAKVAPLPRYPGVVSLLFDSYCGPTETAVCYKW